MAQTEAMEVQAAKKEQQPVDDELPYLSVKITPDLQHFGTGGLFCQTSSRQS